MNFGSRIGMVSDAGLVKSNVAFHDRGVRYYAGSLALPVVALAFEDRETA
jgi:hypothetical protein